MIRLHKLCNILQNFSLKEVGKCTKLNLANARTYCSRPVLRHSNSKIDQKIGPIGWFLLVIPTATCGLGMWQIQRKKWKEQLLADLKMRSQTTPVPLPQNLDDLKDLEYYPVTVRGHFDHSKEIYLGPRSLIIDGDASTQSGLFSQGNKFGTSGYLVVTPFKLADRDMTILVNRGWVPSSRKDPKTRLDAQITSEVALTGVVRLNEPRPTFTPKNVPQSRSWLYRDFDSMCAVTGAKPVFLEAISDCTIEGGPVGGQTRISLRNEHLSYIFTWFSLSGLTSLMWYRMFIQKLPLL